MAIFSHIKELCWLRRLIKHLVRVSMCVASQVASTDLKRAKQRFARGRTLCVQESSCVLAGLARGLRRRCYAAARKVCIRFSLQENPRVRVAVAK